MNQTVQQKLELMVYNCGVFENDAHEIVELAKPRIHKLGGGYVPSWDGPSTDYPDQLYNVMFVALKPVALEYAQTHKPDAWWKAIFE